jgi:hypothetical protein
MRCTPKCSPAHPIQPLLPTRGRFSAPRYHAVKIGDGGHRTVLETDGDVGSTSKEGETQEEEPFLPDKTNQNTLITLGKNHKYRQQCRIFSPV